MTGWIVETLVASTLLMLVVLLLRGPVAHRFGPRAAYALWLMPGLRMLLPPLPVQVAPVPIEKLPVRIDIDALLAAPAQAATIASPAAPVVQAAPFDWRPLLLALWLGGAVLYFLWHLNAYRRFVRRTLASAEQLPMLDREGIEVCASPAIRGPFAAGIFVKSIVLPLDYRRRYSADELRLAIEHEAQHHLRWDMSANLAALILRSLHWFNPIAYLAHRAFRVDQELACDAIVLAGATPAERHAYGSAMLKSACDRLPVAACALGAGDDLKRRLKMMALNTPASRLRIGSGLAALAVGGGLLLTASGGIAAETTKTIEHQVRVAMVQPPEAPLPPEAPEAPAAVPAPPAPPAPPAHLRHARHVIVHGDKVVVDSGDNWVDQAEIRREVAEAQREALQAADEARREGLRAGEEARREALRAADEARREGLRAGAEARAEAARARAQAFAACRGNGDMTVSINGDRRIVRCTGLSEADLANVRRQTIAALEQARAEVARMDPDAGRRARDEALANIDRKIAELKAQ